MEIEKDGTVVEEKKFKKNQILLDKKMHEETILSKQVDRVLDYDIEVVLRMQARKSNSERRKSLCTVRQRFNDSRTRRLRAWRC